MKTKTMKKSLCVFLSIIVMLSVFTAAFPVIASAADPTPTAGGSGYISDDYVNLRAGAGTNYAIVTQMRINTKVTFTDGKLYNTNWYQIKELTTNKTGYVRRDFVKATAPAPTPVATLKLSNTNNTIYNGTQLAITAYNVNDVTWSSSNNAVAVVDSRGVVTGVGAGFTLITAKSGSLVGTCKVYVKNGTPVNLSKTTQLAYRGNSFTLTSTTAGVKWYSCNPAVATVENGVVKTVANGFVTISAYTSTGSNTCLVQVIDPPTPPEPAENEIKLSNTNNTIYNGTQLAITAYDVPSVTWSSSNTDVATVDDNGVVTAVGAGYTAITAKSGSKTGLCKVYVKNGTAVHLSKTSQLAYKGNSFTLTSTTPGVKWYTSNPKVVTVTNGVVKAVDNGYATISCYTSSGSSTCLVHVIDPPDESKIIKLSNTNNTIYKGTQLAITAYNVNSVTWTSSNTNVATVDYRGVVTAVGAGSAVIYAKSEDKTGACKVYVKNGTAVNLSKSYQLAYLGNSFTLTSTTAGVKWYTSNPNVITVTNGVVKTVAKGYATISAYTNSGSSTCLVQVTDPPANQITLSNTNNTIYKGTQLAITAYDVTNVSWSSSNTNVATVDSNGIVTAKGAGNTVITAKSGDKTGTCKVYVKNGTAVNLSKSSQLAYKGNSFTLTSSTPGVKWYSCNPKIATVTNGVVKTVGYGYVTISAYTNTGSATCLVHVTDPPSASVKLSNTSNTIYTGYQLAITATSASPVTWTSSNNSVATVDANGVVTAKAVGHAVITASTGGSSASCNVYVKQNSNNVNISIRSVGSIPCGKSILLKSSTSGVNWYSSNPSIATVKNGVVDTRGTGRVTIAAYTSSGANTCVINVAAKENVRFAYATPNSAPKNSNVVFKAITDLDKTDLYFMVSNGSTSYKVPATSKLQVGNTMVWAGGHVLNISGKWSIKAYSRTASSSTYATTKTSGEGEVFVTNSSDTTTTVLGERRASDQIINLISNYEGFLTSVTADSITSDPTVGYGKVVTSNEMFYNNLNLYEAYAYLVQTVNTGGYTTRTNAFLTSNSIKFNQRQFDALVCFTYNVGSYAIYNDSSLQSVLLNTGSSGTITSGGKGFVNAGGVNLRSGAGTNYSIVTTMSQNTIFTFVDGILYNSNWYKIKLSNGTQGYIYSDYASASGGTRDLNNVNVQNFVNQFFQYHHASGSCYWGLLYRRIDEGEIFFYGDYVRDGENNKKGFKFTCRVNSGFSI